MKAAVYLQDVVSELRKVTWPTFPVVLRNFFAVVIGVALATAMVGAFDFAFLKLLGLILN